MKRTLTKKGCCPQALSSHTSRSDPPTIRAEEVQRHATEKSSEKGRAEPHFVPAGIPAFLQQGLVLSGGGRHSLAPPPIPLALPDQTQWQKAGKGAGQSQGYNSSSELMEQAPEKPLDQAAAHVLTGSLNPQLHGQPTTFLFQEGKDHPRTDWRPAEAPVYLHPPE